jgi:hypothetical protein
MKRKLALSAAIATLPFAVAVFAQHVGQQHAVEY